MSIGAVEDPESDPPVPGASPGLSGLDVDAAAANLAAVGQPAVASIAEAPVSTAPQYGTALAPDEETAYKKWKATLPPRLQSETDYDLRGFFKENPTFSVNTPGQHMTDKFKLPNHETFSNESKYYNDQTAIKGGTWSEGPNGTSIFTPNDPKRQPIVEDAEGNRVAAPPAASSTGAAPATTVPGPSPPGMPEPPPPPALTGDHEKDVQANIEYGRKLTAFRNEMVKRQVEGDKATAGVAAERAGNELAAEREAASRRTEENLRYQQERQKRSDAIERAVQDRMEAQKDLSRGWWATSTTGEKIGAALLMTFGSYQAGMQNVAAAQLGQVGRAENEGWKTVQGLMAQDYQRKQARLASASNSVLEARYGYKDAADNHRAAQNDLDADAAAKYRMIAKEAEQHLRARGASDAEIKGNVIIADALEKAQERETGIHEREEQFQVNREKAAAENQLAKAHLEQGERQIQATAASHKDSLAERHWEHAMALADRADARRGAGGAERRADLQDRRVADKEINDFSKSNQLPELTKQQMALKKASGLLNGKEAADPLTQVLVLQEFDKASKGGTATAAAMNTALSHLAGGSDRIDQFIEKTRTGGLSSAQLATLRKSLGTALAANKDEVDNVHNAFQQTFRKNPMYRDEVVNSGADRLFGSLGYSRNPAPAAAPAAPPPAAAKVISAPGGVRYELGADGNYHKVK
jgi:hypothetical protein